MLVGKKMKIIYLFHFVHPSKLSNTRDLVTRNMKDLKLTRNFLGSFQQFGIH